jgi:hypothetical protein
VIPQPHSLNALIDLPSNASPWQPSAGAEAAIIAKSAAAGGHCAVDIGAGKAGVDADLLDAAAKTLPQGEIACEIWQSVLP